MTPSLLLLGLEAKARIAFDENMVPVEAAMVSHSFPDGYTVTVSYSREGGCDYFYSSTEGGRRGQYPTRDLCYFDVEARLGVGV